MYKPLWTERLRVSFQVTYLNGSTFCILMLLLKWSLRIFPRNLILTGPLLDSHVKKVGACPVSSTCENALPGPRGGIQMPQKGSCGFVLQLLAWPHLGSKGAQGLSHGSSGHRRGTRTGTSGVTQTHSPEVPGELLLFVFMSWSALGHLERSQHTLVELSSMSAVGPGSQCLSKLPRQFSRTARV